MRVFLSVYQNFTLAIPMDDVGAMMLYNQKTEKIIQYDQKNRCTFISLPWLFNMRDVVVPHGVILREWNSKENKVVLLTGEIKRDIDIPNGEFHPIPKALGGTDFSALFSGIKFSGNHPILLLNVKHLAQFLQREYNATAKKEYPIEQSKPAVIPKPPPPPPAPAPVKVIEEPPIIPAVIPKLVEIPKPSPPPAPTPVKVIEEPPIIPAVIHKPVEIPKPSPPAPTPVKVIEEPPIIPAVIPKLVEIPKPSPPPAPTPVKVIEEPPIIPAVIPKPSPPAPDKVIAKPAETADLSSFALDEVVEVCDVIDEPPTHPAVASAVIPKPSPPAPAPVKVIKEPPIIPEVVPKPPSPAPDKVIVKPAETADLSFLTLDEVVEICEIIEEPPIIPAVIPKPPPPAPNKVITKPAETADLSSFALDEVVEICEIIEEPPKSPAVAATKIPKPSPPPAPAPVKVIEEPPIIPTPDKVIAKPAETADLSSLALDEVVEICEIIEEPPPSPAKASAEIPKSSSMIIDDVIETDEVDKVIEANEADEIIEVFDVIDEVIEVYEDTDELATSPAETSAETSAEISKETSMILNKVVNELPTTTAEASESSFTLDEVVEICEVTE